MYMKLSYSSDGYLKAACFKRSWKKASWALVGLYETPFPALSLQLVDQGQLNSQEALLTLDGKNINTQIP